MGDPGCEGQSTSKVARSPTIADGSRASSQLLHSLEPCSCDSQFLHLLDSSSDGEYSEGLAPGYYLYLEIVSNCIARMLPTHDNQHGSRCSIIEEFERAPHLRIEGIGGLKISQFLLCIGYHIIMYLIKGTISM